jgi:hypothetical protein
MQQIKTYLRRIVDQRNSGFVLRRVAKSQEEWTVAITVLNNTRPWEVGKQCLYYCRPAIVLEGDVKRDIPRLIACSDGLQITSQQ